MSLQATRKRGTNRLLEIWEMVNCDGNKTPPKWQDEEVNLHVKGEKMLNGAVHSFLCAHIYTCITVVVGKPGSLHHTHPGQPRTQPSLVGLCNSPHEIGNQRPGSPSSSSLGKILISILIKLNFNLLMGENENSLHYFLSCQCI